MSHLIRIHFDLCFQHSSILDVKKPELFVVSKGLKALTYVVQQDPKLALQHQMTIIECLDHPDLIIKREVRRCYWLDCDVIGLSFYTIMALHFVDAGVALSDH